MALISGSLLAAGLKLVLPSVLDKTFGTFERLFAQHQQNKITREQLLNDMGKALIDGVVEVEKSMADAVKATFASFMGVVQTTPLVARTYAAVVLSQLAVIIFHQVGVPTIAFYSGHDWPSAGATIDWAYFLVGGLCGLGPLLMKTTPADLKKLVGKGGVS